MLHDLDQSRQLSVSIRRPSAKRDSMYFARLFMVLETVLVYIGLAISHYRQFGNFDMEPSTMLVTVVTVALFHIVYSTAGLYEAWRGKRISTELRLIVVSWLVIVCGVGLFAFLSKTGVVVSRLWFGFGVLYAFALVCSFRLSARMLLSHLRRRGYNFRSIVFIGADRSNSDVIQRLRENNWVGLSPVAIFDDNVDLHGSRLQGVPIQGTVADVNDFIEHRRKSGEPVDQVWISLNERNEAAINNLLTKLEDTSVDVRLIPNFFGLHLSSVNFDKVVGIPIVNLSKVRKDNVSELAKTILDYTVASMALFMLSPLLAAIALAVRLDTPGPIFFKQRRYGIDGKEILVWKFRTMRTMENDGQVVQARKDDDRITRVGRILRRTSLDELPQFINVIRGEMSVVGPRPHAVSHNEQYRKKIKGYMWRHKIKPGITGWAQVNGWRGETDTLDKMENRVKYDIEYISNWSIWLDIKIIFMTFYRGFVHKNAY